MVAPAEFLTYIDENAESFIERLKEAVAYPRQVPSHSSSL